MRSLSSSAAILALGVISSLLVACTPAGQVPECGDRAVETLLVAVDQLSERMPKLRVGPAVHSGDCWVGGTTFGAWSYSSLADLQSDGRVAGCALGDIAKFEDEPVLSCSVRSGTLLLYLEWSGTEIGGSIALK